jgi:apolipoprotein N-acyltransferase
MLIGLASIDDLIHKRSTPAEIEAIWKRYDELVTSLAARGARLIVLPEKIAILTAPEADAVQRRLGALAARNQVWVESGLGLLEGSGTRNLSWRFGPDGKLVQVYQKHYLAPVEPEFLPGADYKVSAIGDARYGTAICKDMHFASFGREYARRKAGVMLVPAWDFDLDARMAARITLTRGVESGYTIVRVARDGLLTVSDPYGRIIGEQASNAMPGSSMLVSVPVGAPVPTLYGRIGDLFAWACVGLAVVLLGVGWRDGLRRS